MESLSKTEEPFPTPPPYFVSDESRARQNVRIHHIHIPFSPPPPPPSFALSPTAGCSNDAQSTLPVSAPPSSPPRTKFVSYETELCRSPALTTCPSCQSQVTTQVVYRAGTYAWLMCFVFILFGLVLGCCLIPFFVSHFKDTYHICPRCRRVLYVQRKTCC